MAKSTRFQPAALPDNEVAPLHENPEYSVLLEELTALDQLHAQKTAERKRLVARALGAKVKRSAAERAADLLKGGRVDPTPAADAIAAIDQEIEILRVAISEKARALDAIAADLAYAEAQKLRPQFGRHLKDALSALEAAIASFNGASAVADQLRHAGYRVSSVAMPDLMPAGVRSLAFGELQNFRRALHEMGV